MLIKKANLSILKEEKKFNFVKILIIQWNCFLIRDIKKCFQYFSSIFILISLLSESILLFISWSDDDDGVKKYLRKEIFINSFLFEREKILNFLYVHKRAYQSDSIILLHLVPW